LANAGVHGAVADSAGLATGVNVAAGHVTYRPVAEATDMPCVPLDEALAAVHAS
jgi:alanine dehydrogenase